MGELVNVNRVEVIEAYVQAERIRGDQGPLILPPDPSFPSRVLASFHSHLVAELIADQGHTVAAWIRDFQSHLEMPSFVPELYVSPRVGQHGLDLYLPTGGALEAVRYENIGVRSRLGGIPEQPGRDELAGLFDRQRRYSRIERILETCSAAPPLPEEGSDPWEAMIEFMSRRFHSSPYDKLINPFKPQDPEHAKWDWLTMTAIARGKVLNPPPITGTVQVRFS